MFEDNEKGALRAAGRVEFDQARFIGFWSELRDLLTNRPTGLLSFDDVKTKLHLGEQVYRGLQNIPLEQIVGSVGRYKDFTRNFLPKNPELVHRWSDVYAKVNDLTGVPPIDVFQVDDVYFVRDGNHRVSIARQMGLDTIEAHVTELKTPIHLAPNMSRRQLNAAAAYGQFLEATKLDINRPNQESIQLSEASRYNDLLDQIRMMQNSMAQQRGYAVSMEMAAMRWYDRVYEPTIRLVRKYKLLDQFPKRTEADLYVWISEHLNQLLEVYSEENVPATLSDALVDFMAAHKIPVPKRLLTEDNQAVVGDS